MILAEFLYIITMIAVCYTTIRFIICLIKNWDDDDANDDLMIGMFLSLLVLIPASIVMVTMFILTNWGALIAASFINLMEMEL